MLLGPDQGHDPKDLARLSGFLASGSDSDDLAAGYVRNNLAFTRYDARLFAELVASDGPLKATARRLGAGEASRREENVGTRGYAGLAEAPPTLPALLFDLFLLFYKFVPRFLEDGETDPSFSRANRPVLARLLAADDTAIARLSTATDETASALAAADAAEQLLAELAARPDLLDWMSRQGTTPEVPEGLPEELPHGGAKDPIQHLAGPGTTPPDDRPNDPLSARPPAGDLGAATREAAAAASAEAHEHRGALAAWGLEPADLSRVPMGERLPLARALRTQRTRDLADLLGRFKRARTALRRDKLRSPAGEIHGVTTSGDLPRVLPSEIAGGLGAGDLHRENDFFRRLSERSLPSYSLRSREPKVRGPVVALVDSSWSMAGEPMAWASAVALALAQAASSSAKSSGGRARSGARPVTAIFFNTKIVLETHVRPGERDPRKFLAIATVAAEGGTSYDAPLSRALEVLERRPSARPAPPGRRGARAPMDDADFLLVTDGQCGLTEAFAPEFARRKAALGCALVCVLVGDRARAAALEPHAERLIHARDLARASGARDAASRVFHAM